MGRTLSDKTKKIIELRKKGLCSVEISEIVGSDTKYIRLICKKHNVPFSENEKNKSIKLAQQKLFHDDSYAKDYIASRTDGRFEYVSGYTGCDSKITIRCTKCGFEFERSFGSFRGNKGKHISCPECKRKELEQKEIEAHKSNSYRKHEAKLNASKRKFNKQFKQFEIKICPVCGSAFVGNRKYCSNKCLLVVSNARAKDKRIKKLKSVVIDKDITLEGLYNRDGGVCWICGGQCDWNDTHIIINRLGEEQSIAGDNYPSIDHVTELCNGGLHSWGNIKLAHRKCNAKRYYSKMA